MLDENKDFNEELNDVIPKPDTEKTPEEEIEKVTEEMLANFDESAPAGAEASEAAAPEAEGEAQASDAQAQPASDGKAPLGKLLMKPVLISAAIVACALLAVIVIRIFFNTSVSGDWKYTRQVQVLSDKATGDSPYETIDVDYFFKFRDDGTVNATIGTVTSNGTYTTYKNDDGKTVMTMDLTDLITSYNFLAYGEYELSVSGNAFTGRTMTLTSSQDADNPLEMKTGGYTAPELKREDEFTPKDELVGKWVFSQDGYDLSYEFTKDGKAYYTEQAATQNPYTGALLNINYRIDGIYSCDDSTITVSYCYTKDSTMKISYQLDGDTLYVNSYPFIREGAATKD